MLRKKFQQKYGAEVYPNKEKIDLEITYNKLQIFKKLATYYGYVSVFLIFFVILQIFNNKKWIGLVVKVLIGITILLFTMHLLGLMSRWYISGNAPWSNAYESIIYVAWATMLFGLIFGRKSRAHVPRTRKKICSWRDPQCRKPKSKTYRPRDWKLKSDSIVICIVVSSVHPY